MNVMEPITRRTERALERFKLYSVNELVAMPEPPWLVDGVIEEGALGVLVGKEASGKSFLAIDLALSIATGRAWNGRTVTAGPVVYVVGEGASGIGRRVKAWMKAYNEREVRDAFFVLEAPQLAERGDALALIDAIYRSDTDRPRLIVFDTLARCFVGKDENSSNEMGLLVEGCLEIQRETGAAILVLHHTDKQGTAERGSSALPGAADVIMRIRQSAGRFELTNTKQKDAELFDKASFRLEAVAAEDGGRDSCVLQCLDGKFDSMGTVLNDREQRALTALAGLGTAASGAWRAALNAKHKTFDNWRKALVAKGLVATVDGISNHYRLTDEGELIVAIQTDGGSKADLTD